MRNFRSKNCGSSCRWAGESDPRVIFRNIIQRPRHKITGNSLSSKVSALLLFLFYFFFSFSCHPHIHEIVIVDCFWVMLWLGTFELHCVEMWLEIDFGRPCNLKWLDIWAGFGYVCLVFKLLFLEITAEILLFWLQL